MALLISPNPTVNILDCQHNVLVGNNIDNFSASAARVLFNKAGPYSANYNTIVGGGGSLVDLGIGNKIKGDYTVSNTPGSVGAEVSEGSSEWK